MVAEKICLCGTVNGSILDVGKINLSFSISCFFIQIIPFYDHAGKRTIGEADGLYEGFASAIDGYTDFEAAKDPDGSAKENLIRLGNILPENQTADKLGMYAAKNAAASVSEAKTGAGIYFLENSVKKDAFTTENKNFGYYRLPYAKVYTTYIPNEVWKLEDGKLVKETNFQKGTTFSVRIGIGSLIRIQLTFLCGFLAGIDKAVFFPPEKCCPFLKDVSTRAVNDNQEDYLRNIFIVTSCHTQT